MASESPKIACPCCAATGTLQFFEVFGGDSAKCGYCDGTGLVQPPSPSVDCPDCGGQNPQNCRACLGLGRLVSCNCSTCGGGGTVKPHGESYIRRCHACQGTGRHASTCTMAELLDRRSRAFNSLEWGSPPSDPAGRKFDFQEGLGSSTTRGQVFWNINGNVSRVPPENLT